MHWLKQHLNMTDLLVVFVYGLSELIWIYTYQWRASNMVCKFVQFGRAFAFYASSNLIAAVAVNRLLSIVSPAKDRQRVAYRSYWLLFAAWVLAAICSLPQVWVWRTLDIPICSGGTWRQCNTRWDTPDQPDATAITWRRWYHVFHLTTVFWLPFGITAICYSLLMMLIADTNGRHEGKATKLEVVSTTKKGLNNHTQYEGIQVCVEDVDEPDGGTMAPREDVSHHRSRTTLAMTISLKLTLCYVVCYLPYNAIQTLKLIYGHAKYNDLISDNWDFLNVFILINSVVNPFIYGTFVTKDASPHVLGTSYRVQKKRAKEIRLMHDIR